MSTTTIQTIVLSDGKPGHYNQSLGVIQQIPECSYQRVDVTFRSKGRDNLLRVLTRIFGGFRLPARIFSQWLRMALQPEVLNQLDTINSADLILSTGSSVAAVNLLLGQRLNAKTVTCRRPSPVGVAYFDLAILPKMYWRRRYKHNICKTIGVPNQISPEKLDTRRDQLLENPNLISADLHLPNQRRIAMLIGGEDRYDTISEETASHLITALRRIAPKLDCQILLTTSRRTPIAVENLIGERLSDPKLCPILVLAHRESPLAHPIETIFALADLIIVTEDSFSMVCEAASSGRRVIVLEVDHKTHRRPKRCRVYPEIMRRASVRWCRVKELEEHTQQGLADRTPVEPLRDTQIAAAAIRQLFDETRTN